MPEEIHSFEEAQEFLKQKRQEAIQRDQEAKEQERKASAVYDKVHDLMQRNGYLVTRVVTEGAIPGLIGSGHPVSYLCLEAQASLADGTLIRLTQSPKPAFDPEGSITLEEKLPLSESDDKEIIIFKKTAIEDEFGNRLTSLSDDFVHNFGEYLLIIEQQAQWSYPEESTGLMPKEGIKYPCRKEAHSYQIKL